MRKSLSYIFSCTIISLLAIAFCGVSALAEILVVFGSIGAIHLFFFFFEFFTGVSVEEG